MRIISGKFKGRKIPFLNRKFNDADITTQKVKEALFSIIGQKITEKNFLDLFSCSGQIGLEALSWGANYVVLNDKNNKRYNFLLSIQEIFNQDNNLFIYNLPMDYCIKKLNSENKMFDYIYLDPPYIKEKAEIKIYDDIFSVLSKYQIYNQECKFIVQHYTKNILKDKYYSFEKYKEKKYGNNTLTFYAFNDKE